MVSYCKLTQNISNSVQDDEKKLLSGHSSRRRTRWQACNKLSKTLVFLGLSEGPRNEQGPPLLQITQNNGVLSRFPQDAINQ
jgi:hypothetical protein